MKKKEPLKKRGVGRGRKIGVTKPKSVPSTGKKKNFHSGSEEEIKENIPKHETKLSVDDKDTAKKEIVATESSVTAMDLKAAVKKEETGTRQTVLKLDSVEELLRKRREVKQKLDAKATEACKTRGKG